MEILRISPRKPTEKPNTAVKVDQIRTIQSSDLLKNSTTTIAQTPPIDSSSPGTKFIIFRSQSGNNYLQQVPNNVISLNPTLKIRPITELSKPTQPTTQPPQLLPTSVPPSVLKILKEQKMTEPPQLASLSNAPQFNASPNLMSILKPKDSPNITQKMTVETAQSATSPSNRSSGSSEPSISPESVTVKKNCEFEP